MERLALSDLKLQPYLMARLFALSHPDVRLDDPDARTLAAREWVADASDPQTPAARFRRYVEKKAQDGTPHEVALTDAAFDEILRAIGVLPETVH